MEYIVPFLAFRRRPDATPVAVGVVDVFCKRLRLQKRKPHEVLAHFSVKVCRIAFCRLLHLCEHVVLYGFYLLGDRRFEHAKVPRLCSFDLLVYEFPWRVKEAGFFVRLCHYGSDEVCTIAFANERQRAVFVQLYFSYEARKDSLQVFSFCAVSDV